MSETAEIVSVMRDRAAMYNLLGRVFRVEADQQLLDELRSMRYPLNTGNAQADAAYLRLFTFMKTVRESTLTDLAVDYARVFLGSGSLDAHAAYPYESVYTSPHGLTMQDARDEILAIYRSEGLGKSDTWREPEDHLAAELEFMKALALRTADTLDAGNKARAAALLRTQQGFLDEHLLGWAPVMLADVSLYAKLDFYPAFAALTQAFLDEDEALLDELTGGQA